MLNAYPELGVMNYKVGLLNPGAECGMRTLNQGAESGARDYLPNQVAESGARDYLLNRG